MPIQMPDELRHYKVDPVERTRAAKKSKAKKKLIVKYQDDQNTVQIRKASIAGQLSHSLPSKSILKQRHVPQLSISSSKSLDEPGLLALKRGIQMHLDTLAQDCKPSKIFTDILKLNFFMYDVFDIPLCYKSKTKHNKKVSFNKEIKFISYYSPDYKPKFFNKFKVDKNNTVQVNLCILWSIEYNTSLKCLNNLR